MVCELRFEGATLPSCKTLPVRVNDSLWLGARLSSSVPDGQCPLLTPGACPPCLGHPFLVWHLGLLLSEWHSDGRYRLLHRTSSCNRGQVGDTIQGFNYVIIGLQHLGAGKTRQVGRQLLGYGDGTSHREPRVISLQGMERLLGSGWGDRREAGVICGGWEDPGIS